MKSLVTFRLVILALAFVSAPAGNASAAGELKVPLIFTGGHDTDPRDRGRPVVLVAAALGVPPQVFRDAFRHVHPAPPSQQPQPEQVRANKRALMERLGSYGVTNNRLDEVSNYYRYRGETGELWRHVDAAGFATVSGGKVVAITITEPGAGYTTPPVVRISAGITVYPMAVLSSAPISRRMERSQKLISRRWEMIVRSVRPLLFLWNLNVRPSISDISSAALLL